MRKIVLFFLVLGILFPVTSLWAQKQSVMITNATSKKVLIDDQVINPRASKELSITVKGNVGQFTLAYYDLLVLSESVNLARKVNKGRIFLRDFDPANNDVSDASSADEETTQSSKGATADFSGASGTPNDQTQNPGDWWSTATVILKNGLKEQTLFVPVGSFKGLALASGKYSSRKATLETGPVQFPALLMTETDAATSTGVKYAWGIVDIIIVEGQDTLEIKPENIMKANDGETITKTIISKLGFDFSISEGASSGKVVTDNTPIRLEWFVGWNIVPIRYKGSNGLPVQAVLILLINDTKRPLMASGKAKDKEVSISPSDIRIINFSR